MSHNYVNRYHFHRNVHGKTPMDLAKTPEMKEALKVKVCDQASAISTVSYYNIFSIFFRHNLLKNEKNKKENKYIVAYFSSFISVLE